MADHLQQQILDAYQATLVAAATSAGSRVYLDRVDEIPQGNLPALHVEGGSESIETDAFDWPPVQNRAFLFTVSAVVGLSNDAAEAARGLLKQVEQALFASQAVALASGLVKNLRLIGLDPDKDPAGAVSLFTVRQTWQADYTTRAGTPDASF